MSFTYTYSREQLQGMQAKYRKEKLFTHIDNNLSTGVLEAATQGKKEFFWTNRPTGSRGMVSYPVLGYTNEELISALLEKFPGTHIEYQETWVETRPGMKEEKKGILIDWS
jgi:hypothetical protein